MIQAIINSSYNGDLKKELPYKVKPEYARYNKKFTKRRYWYEQHEKTGYWRVVYESYNSVKDSWSQPQKGLYFPFVALYQDISQLKYIYINEYMHPSDIEALLKRYSFDKKQVERLEYLIAHQAKKFRE